MKRAEFAADRFRVSVAGVDVDAAEDYQFVLHEGHLMAQPFFADFVTCPVSGTSGSLRQPVVAVSTPSLPVASELVTILFPIPGDGAAYWPLPPSSGFTGDEKGSYALIDDIQPNEVSIRFIIPANVPAPPGAWLVLIRGEPN